MQEFYAWSLLVPRIPPSHLPTSPFPSLQVAWVLAYTTAANDAYLNRLVALGILPPLLERVTAAVEQVGSCSSCFSPAVGSCCCYLSGGFLVPILLGSWCFNLSGS